MDYLRWAKLHRPARFELTISGVPPVRPTDLAGPLPVRLEGEAAYGDPTFIEAVAKLYNAPIEGVVPVPGTSSANFIALAATTRHGDCVMLERPAYQPLYRVASFLGLRVIPLARRPGAEFAVDPGDVEAGLRQGARAVVLSNLHNPSGCLISRGTIRKIAEQCARVDATLIVDEVYLDAAHLTGAGARWTAATVAGNVVATNSLTKVYGMGSLRAGWLFGSASFADKARRIMDLLSVENAAPSIALALHALSTLEALKERYRRFYKDGRDVFRRWLAEEPRVKGYRSFGALFECLQLPDGMDASRLNELLLAEYDTQVVEGRFFGLKDHIRVAIALAPADLLEALSRISQAMNRIL